MHAVWILINFNVRAKLTYSLSPSLSTSPEFFNMACASALVMFLVGILLIEEITSPSLMPDKAAFLPGFTWKRKTVKDLLFDASHWDVRGVLLWVMLFDLEFKFIFKKLSIALNCNEIAIKLKVFNLSFSKYLLNSSENKNKQKKV